MFQDFLRQVRFSLLRAPKFAWKSPIERRKIATYHSRRMAALNSLLHVIPLGGALALLIFSWTKLWIGGNENNGTVLQFVAKLHELLMQASLVEMILYLVRAQALDGFIPLGALSAAAQAPQLSYLWSLDFISAITSPAFCTWRRIIFVISMMGLLLMASLVGPSGAVLMIPRPGMANRSVATVRYINHSESDIYPAYLDKQSNLNL